MTMLMNRSDDRSRTYCVEDVDEEGLIFGNDEGIIGIRYNHLEVDNLNKIKDRFERVVISNSTIEGAEEYWKEFTEKDYNDHDNSNTTLMNITNLTISSSPQPRISISTPPFSTSTSTPSIPINFNQNIQSHSYHSTHSSTLNAFDPAFSPPQIGYTSKVPTSTTRNVDLSTTTSPFNFRNQIPPSSPPTQPYDILIPSHSIQSESIERTYNSSQSNYLHTFSATSGSSNDNSNNDEIMNSRYSEASTQTDEEDSTVTRGRSRSRSKSRKGSSSRSRKSSTSTSTSNNRKLIEAVDYQRGRSSSKSTTPHHHHHVIMPSSALTYSKTHSSSRQRLRTPSSTSPSPPLSPSNSVSSFDSLEEDSDNLEEEEDEFEFDQRFIDLTSLRNSRELINKSNNKLTLYCGEQYRLLAIDRCKYKRTGQHYFRASLDLD